jgi:glutamyl endopeptidase
MTTFSRGKHPIGFVQDRIRLQEFPGLDPRWRTLVDEDLSSPPWASICAISIVHGERAQLAGTGWLAGPTTVITAAHVIGASSKAGSDFGLQLKFPTARASVDVIAAHVHEHYRGDIESRFDPFDIAALRIDPVELTALRIAEALPPAATVEVPGYPSSEEGRLVTHEARAIRPEDGRLVLHQAHTKEGHSGAPVLLSGLPPADRSVIALHVHGFQANPFESQFPAHNVALVMTEEMILFIQAHMGT